MPPQARRSSLRKKAVGQFKARLRGELLFPGGDAYEKARTVWNGLIERRPALIARCMSVNDIAQAVQFARDHDLLTSVRGGAHNIAGKAVCTGGLVIDLSNMRTVQVDPVKRIARVEGGAMLGDLDYETQRFGLATTVGVVSTTGVAGLTLGGGVGWLARKYGLACDNLLAADVVDSDGQRLTATVSKNSDLFWGLRGGGGNLGIVTSLTYQLHQVGPEVLAGVVVHPIEKARQAMKFYFEYTNAAPDEVAANASLLTYPNGQRVLAIAACYTGPIGQGERALRPIRQFGSPLSDQIAPIPYTKLQAMGDDHFPKGLNYYWKTHFLREISDEAIDVIVSHFSKVTSRLSAVSFQQYGGAVARVDESETAFGHRDARYDFIPAAVWSDQKETETHVQWARDLWEMMEPFATGGEYVNNLGEEGETRIRAAYGGNYERMVALKNKYDPTNFFKLNANIRPTI